MSTQITTPSYVLALIIGSLIASQAWPAGGGVAAAACLLPVVLIGLAAHSTAVNVVPLTGCAAGLVVDAVSGGPLGQWALINALAGAVAPSLVGSGSVGRRTAGLAALVTLAAAVHAVIGSGFAATVPAGLPEATSYPGLVALGVVQESCLGAAAILTAVAFFAVALKLVTSTISIVARLWDGIENRRSASKASTWR